MKNKSTGASRRVLDEKILLCLHADERLNDANTRIAAIVSATLHCCLMRCVIKSIRRDCSRMICGSKFGSTRALRYERSKWNASWNRSCTLTRKTKNAMTNAAIKALLESAHWKANWWSKLSWCRSRVKGNIALTLVISILFQCSGGGQTPTGHISGYPDGE